MGTSAYRPENALDGSDDTFWSSSSDIKFEFVSVKFTFPKDIRSVKCQLQQEGYGPMMVIIEKSSDGIYWARSTEVSDMLGWGNSLQIYPLVRMDVLPAVSSFALRNQADPRWCLGVRPTPAEDPEDPPIALMEDAPLELQPCADSKTTQYWQLRSDFFLANAADNTMVVRVRDLSGATDRPFDGLALEMGKHECVTTEDGVTTCPPWFHDSRFVFHDQEKGGLMASRSAQQNIVMTFAALEEGSPVSFAKCGDDANVPADISSCNNHTLQQFEAKPMFLVEPNKMAVACSPYTHMDIEPIQSPDETFAMALCAKDPDCIAYNYAASDATCSTDPPCEGKYKGYVWACESLHEVHSGVAGWSLGVRCGKLEPFIEEEKKKEEKTKKRADL